MHQSEQIDLIAKAIIEAKNNFTKAKSSKKNSHLGNTYATLSDVLDAVEPALNSQAVIVMQHMLETSTDSVMHLATRLMHSSGQFMEFQYNMPIEKKTAQAYGSTTSYARRYALAAILGISQTDDDAEISKMKPEDYKRRADNAQDEQEMRDVYMSAKKALSAAEWRVIEPYLAERGAAIKAAKNAAEAPTGGFNPARPTKTAIKPDVDAAPLKEENAQNIESFE